MCASPLEAAGIYPQQRFTNLSWIVSGRSGDYTVTLENGFWTCECMDYLNRHHQCRHIRAVSMLQRLALLDKEAVEILEKLARQRPLAGQEEDDSSGCADYQSEPMTQKQKLDAVFGE